MIVKNIPLLWKPKQLPSKLLEKYKEYLITYFHCDPIKIQMVKYLKLNSYQFRNGMGYVHNSGLFEIENVLCVNDKLFLNSIEVCKDYAVEKFIFELDELIIKKTYECKTNGGKNYLIMETLELRDLFQ